MMRPTVPVRHRVRLRRHGDLAIAVVLFALAQLELFTRHPTHDVGWLGRSMVIAVATLPIAKRRQYPTAVVIVVAVVGELATAASGNVDTFYAIVAGALIMFYSVGAYAARRPWIGLAAGLATFWAGDASAHHPPGEYIASTVLVAGPWLAGLALRHQRGQSSQLRQLAADLRAEREKAERAAVEAERGRIAREMHDVVAHALSLIAIQADAASAALEVRQELAVAAVDTIREVSRESLDEMRRVLHLLHDDGAGTANPAIPPTLRDLNRLVDRARGAGLLVTVEVDGAVDGLPPPVDLAAYRVVQEALTNVRKHGRAGDGGRAHVHVANAGGELTVDVTNDGSAGPDRLGSTASHGGYGLIGLRDRVEAHGGRFEAAATLRRLAGQRDDSFLDLDWRDGGQRRCSTTMTTVVLADDQELVRAGFRLILTLAEIEVVGEAGDGRSTVAIVRESTPDVVLMDIRMPIMDGIEATRQIVASGSTTRVLVLTTFDLDEHVYDAMRVGASGFLLKDAPREQLVAGVHQVARGDTLLAPTVTRRLIERFVTARPARDPGPFERLSARELEVLELVAKGLSNVEIGQTLFVTESTVKTYVTRLLAKLDVRDRLQAVVMAYESGVIGPGR